MELQDGSDGGPPSVNTVNTLGSLVPILNMLPGCVVENGIYYVNGLASPDTRNKISGYTASITHFLFDWLPQGSVGSLSPGALLQLFNISNPLFPNLAHLEISTGPKCTVDLSYLNILLSPSLRTVHISSIPSDQKRHLDCFFAVLPEAAPRLENLRISSQCLPPSAFDLLHHFRSLQELALIQVAYDYDEAFIYQLGSLPHLRTLAIDSCRLREQSHFRGAFSRGCGHCALIPCPLDCRPTPRTPPPQSDASPPDDNVPFPSLQELEITGYLPEIHLLLQSVSPTRVERLTLWLALATFDSTSNTRELTREWIEAPTTKYSSDTPRPEEHAQIQGFAHCLEQFLSSASLLSSLSISRVPPTYQMFTARTLRRQRFSLPLSTLVSTLGKPTLRKLDFGMWATPAPALQEAMDVISHQSPSEGAKPKLETLQVCPHSPLTLSATAKLVQAYPALKHLACAVKSDFDTIKTYTQQAALSTSPLESLESITLLYADSPSVQPTNQAVISAAFYIHTTFPNSVLIIPGEPVRFASPGTPHPNLDSRSTWSLTSEDAKDTWLRIQQLTELCTLSVTNYVERTKSQTPEWDPSPR